MKRNVNLTKPVARQKQLAILITLGATILMTILSIITLFFIGPEDKTMLDNYMRPLIALAAGVAFYLTQRDRYVRGVFVLLGTIITTSMVYAIVVDNIGWQAAIRMLVVVATVANLTLSEVRARRISGVAFVLAILIVLADLFLPGITSTRLTTASIGITAGLGFIYLSHVLYQFRLYSLRTKLAIAFIFLSIISVTAATLAISTTTLSQMNERVQQQLTTISELTSSSFAAELDKQVDLMRTLANNRSLIAELVKVNLTAENDINVLKELDQRWMSIPETNTMDPLIRSVIESGVSPELRRFKTAFPEHREVFITNRYGANVAATDRTTDYYQADEEWWQVAYNNGAGGAYISQPYFDESAQSLAVQIAVPIFQAGTNEIAGILRSTISLSIFNDAFETGRFGETGRTEIYLPDGTELEMHFEESGEAEIEIEEAPADFIAALQQNRQFHDTTHDGTPVLAAVSPLLREVDDEEDITALQALNWRVVSMQEREEALLVITEATRNAQVVGLGAILAAALLAIFMAQYLATPISRLTQAAEAVSSGNLNVAAAVETEDEIGTLADSFNRMTSQLRDSLTNLEKRVAERTTDLEIARQQSEKRANQLLATGEISKIINSEQNLETLLTLVSRLVSERFGYYHTGIFLIDETKQYAVLQSANSEGGRNMLNRGHKLKVGEGIVGYVAKFGIPRIALDVGQDAVYFNNPDLPNTRSEMALPLNFLDETIGVLDVQSEKPGAFTNDDTNTLRILADQIAIAIENTRLFEQTQQTLGELQTLYRRNLQEGWKAFNREEGLVGYYQSLTGGKKVVETVDTPEIQQTVNRGETTVFHADGKTDQPALVVPIKLRGQIIGVIHIKAPSRDRMWTANEINLSEAVSERLSLALENARLLQDSQRQAIMEQTISDITGKIGSSINLENVLQTAVEELGRTIPGSEVIIKIKDDNRE